VIGAPAARVGVVIAYGSTQTLCDWLAEAERIAEVDGARVLVVDRRGVGSSSQVSPNPQGWTEDVVAGARWLERHGARRVALIGASFGGPIAVTTASPTGPRMAVFPPRPEASVIAPPCAAILVSPATDAEADGGSISALAIRDFRSPLFIVYEEGTRQFRDAAASLRDHLRSVGAPRVLLLAIPGTDHSSGLLEKHAAARAFVDRGVRSCQKS
jgi:pimeloyl-ACP methyl ester carboxylesterase